MESVLPKRQWRARIAPVPCRTCTGRGRCMELLTLEHFSGHVNDTFSAVLNDDEVPRSEEHTSELQSLMRLSYAVCCLRKQTGRRMPIPSTLRARTAIHKYQTYTRHHITHIP